MKRGMLLIAVITVGLLGVSWAKVGLYQATPTAESTSSFDFIAAAEELGIDPANLTAEEKAEVYELHFQASGVPSGKRTFVDVPIGSRYKDKDQYDDYLAYDTFIWSAYPNNNYGSWSLVYVGYDNGWEGGLFGYYDCPSGTVTGAELWVNIVSNNLGQSKPFKVALPASAWDEYSVTYNNGPAWYTNTIQTTYCISGTGYDWYTADYAVQWVCNSGYSNYGFIMYPGESWGGSGQDLALRAWDSGQNDFSYVRIYYTDVNIPEFTAIGENRRVIVKWSTTYEYNNAGWNLYRAEGENGKYKKLNDSLIEPYQYDYEYIDTDVENGTQYCYKLEAVDLDGSTQMFGPKCATPNANNSEGNSTDLPSSDDDSDGLGATGGCGRF